MSVKLTSRTAPARTELAEKVRSFWRSSFSADVMSDSLCISEIFGAECGAPSSPSALLGGDPTSSEGVRMEERGLGFAEPAPEGP